MPFRTLCIILTLMIGHGCSQAQRHEIISPDIASLEVRAGTDWTAPLVLTLHETPLYIDFDDMTHEYRRYTYHIQHCEADWTPSEGLFETDYIDGFNNGNVIDHAEQSINTNYLYTHYSLQIPNSKCRIIMSGNYMLTIFDEDDDNRPLLKVCFMVVEPLMGAKLEVTPATDRDIRGRHQQVELSLNYGRLRVTNPKTQIKTVVMQNNRWDNAVIGAEPQFIQPDGLRWSHCSDFIFNGGNEYRRFEMLDVSHTTMGLESINWDGTDYHAWIWTDEPRPSYVYDEDTNGSFLIRNSEYEETNTTTEYIKTHFRLKCPKVKEGEIYINADWTQDRFLPSYRMQYNEEEDCYEAEVTLKQGYYSYQYLLLLPDGTTSPLPCEGNFWQTENTYQALVYFRSPTDRTDRLVAFTTISSR